MVIQAEVALGIIASPIMTKKLTIQAMRELAESRGGKCLSNVYVDNHSKLDWQCAKGHQWMATPSHIQQGQWCPKCHGTPRKTLGEMQDIAAARGGKCLSSAYEGVFTKLLWECSHGHQWQTMPQVILRGTWCPVCAGKGKTIEDMKNLAAQHGGNCLSEQYKNSNTKLLWQCQSGHEWEATPNHVQGGRWCPVCGRRRAWERRKAR